MQKRGKDFWSEFELYAADLLVGVVVDIALVGMLAPYARIGKVSASKGLLARAARICGALPSRLVLDLAEAHRLCSPVIILLEPRDTA